MSPPPRSKTPTRQPTITPLPKIRGGVSGSLRFRVEGDIAYGPTFAAANLRFTSDFRQLFINAQRLILDPRVFAPLSLRLGYLSGRAGINQVLSGMLRCNCFARFLRYSKLGFSGSSRDIHFSFSGPVSAPRAKEKLN